MCLIVQVLPDLVTPDIMLERLSDPALLGGGEDDYEGGGRDTIEKYMRDLSQMMEGISSHALTCFDTL
jgi:hypothetical protein